MGRRGVVGALYRVGRRGWSGGILRSAYVNIFSILDRCFPVWYTMPMAYETSIEITRVESTAGEIVDVPSKPLSLDEDNFALAIIEYGGNLRKAYTAVFGDAYNPMARARELMGRSDIALRIRDITESVHESALISLGSHLVELAGIRDLAKDQGNLKVALDSEVQRGKVAGFYIGKSDAAPTRKPSDLANPMVLIQISTSHDQSI